MFLRSFLIVALLCGMVGCQTSNMPPTLDNGYAIDETKDLEKEQNN